MIEHHFARERAAFATSGLDLGTYLDSLGLELDSVLTLPRRSLSSTQVRLQSFIVDSRNFWAVEGPRLSQAVDETPKMAVTVHNELFNSAYARRLSLLFDTVFVADGADFLLDPPPKRSAPLLLRGLLYWCFEILELKDLILAGSDPPLAIVFPQQFALGKNGEQAKQMSRRTEPLAYLAICDAFRFDNAAETFEGVMEQFCKLGESEVRKRLSIERIVSMSEGIFTNPLNWFPSAALTDRFKGGDIGKLLDRDSFGAPEFSAILDLYRSAFFVLANREANAQVFGADCALGRDIWRVNARRNEILNSHFGSAQGLDEHDLIAASLKVGFNWLQDVPNEKILELRENQGIETLRNVFKTEHLKLKTASSADFSEMSREYEESVRARIENYREMILRMERASKSKRRRLIGSFGVATTLGITALAFPALLPLGIAAAGYSAIVGGTSILDLIQSARELHRAKNSPERRVMNLLLEKTTKTTKP